METIHRVHAASPDVLTLKIKSEDGNRVFILKMCFSETIGHLRRYLDAHRWDHISLHFDSVPNATASVPCVTEEAVSLVMTSSARAHAAATAMTVRWSVVAVLRAKPCCCCRRGNAERFSKSATCDWATEESHTRKNFQMWNNKWWKSLFLKVQTRTKIWKYKHLFSLLQKQTSEMLRLF